MVVVTWFVLCDSVIVCSLWVVGGVVFGLLVLVSCLVCLLDCLLCACFGLCVGLFVVCDFGGFGDWLQWGLGISGGCFGLLGCGVWIVC